jgi:hypothetical protein
MTECIFSLAIMLAKSSRKRLKVIAFERNLQMRKRVVDGPIGGKWYVCKYLDNGHVHP